MRGQANVSIAGKPLQKALRNRMTDAEQRLWQGLRERQLAGCKFRRQHPFFDYVLDFVCLEKSLVVEVGDGQHLDNEKDRLRDQRLAAAGFRVLRFRNNQVLQETDAVLEAICIALQERQNIGSSRFKGEDRRGMGPEAGTILTPSPDQPHLPPGHSRAGFARTARSDGAEPCSAKPRRPHPREGGGEDGFEARA